MMNITNFNDYNQCNFELTSNWYFETPNDYEYKFYTLMTLIHKCTKDIEEGNYHQYLKLQDHFYNLKSIQENLQSIHSNKRSKECIEFIFNTKIKDVEEHLYICDRLISNIQPYFYKYKNNYFNIIDNMNFFDKRSYDSIYTLIVEYSELNIFSIFTIENGVMIHNETIHSYNFMYYDYTNYIHITSDNILRNSFLNHLLFDVNWNVFFS